MAELLQPDEGYKGDQIAVAFDPIVLFPHEKTHDSLHSIHTWLTDHGTHWTHFEYGQTAG